MLNTLNTQVMKRLLTIGLMLASAFALTNCAEQLDTPIQENDIIADVTEQEFETGTPFEVYIDDMETKTSYSSNKTIWVPGDGIALYSKPSASTGTPTYSRHEKFTYVAPTEQGANHKQEHRQSKMIPNIVKYPHDESTTQRTKAGEHFQTGG